MKDLVIVSDFDGTITQKDSLYHFFSEFASEKWLEVEQDWVDGKIGSTDCLEREFELVPYLNEELIDAYTDTIKIDPYFREFNELRKTKGLDFIVVSDGVDYFINRILQKNGIKDIKIISNHGEFIGDKFRLTFPHAASNCARKAGTCKCSVINDLKKLYKKIAYIGDGFSDLCCANKVNILFAKSHLLAYCKENNISYIEYENFKGVIKHDFIK